MPFISVQNVTNAVRYTGDVTVADKLCPYLNMDGASDENIVKVIKWLFFYFIMGE